MLAYESLLTWVVIGAVAGWLAGLIVEGFGFGLLGNVVLGSLGAILAGLALALLDVSTHTTLGNIIAATLGAVVLLLLVELVRRR